MDEKNQQIEIYKVLEGEIVFDVDKDNETIWATRTQIAQLFSVTPQNITMHMRNIFSSGELDEKRTSKNSLLVQTEGDRKTKRSVKMYNLDAIISVGYRVNSKKATDFRIWATKTLKQYVVNGIAINEHRLSQLEAKKLKNVENMMGVVRRLITRQELDGPEANGVLEVISKYAGSFKTLEQFDDGHIDLKNLNPKKRQKTLNPEDCEDLISKLRATLSASDLFGKRRNNSFEGSLSAIYQSFDGAELYPTVAEKAANLLYFIIKDHPFYDGNKRIGSLLFIVFLTINDCNLTRNGETKISDRALTAIALLIAESNPAEKSLIISLVCKLLED